MFHISTEHAHRFHAILTLYIYNKPIYTRVTQFSVNSRVATLDPGPTRGQIASRCVGPSPETRHHPGRQAHTSKCAVYCKPRDSTLGGGKARGFPATQPKRA